MQNLDALFGINMEGLCDSTEPIQYPNTVAGRVMHLDADFIAYIATAEKAGEEDTKPWQDCIDHLKEMLETFRLLAGAEKMVLHVTPKDSDKGGRYEQALLKEYQATRGGRHKPRYLHMIRDFMVTDMGGIPWLDREADDGMAQAQWKAYLAGEKDKSIIVTKDKDLRIVPGLHLNWDTGEIVETDVTGWVELVETKSGKMCKGFGAMFLFAQMLMGDDADNIAGVRLIHRDIMNAQFPTKAVTSALEVLRDEKSTEKRKISASKTLQKRNHGKCGHVKAYELLENCKTIQEAFQVVSTLYKYAEKTGILTDYRTNEPVDWMRAFQSELQLLWMRRNEDPNDGIFFLQEYCK